ncbi:MULTISPECIES: glycine--tRNA ligase subunit beta [Halomonadaceae]|uniref:Glycine--tRNA ligase beta subunit n=1 Tax=Vreelandella halophila TaxID=86177 RepID=A0A9X4Y9W8_9GAMM|nr:MULTISPECIES: glycine--tRNA ligase subunit beta [Halomonas]MYL25909.1 glycine--tRNA ligase subunit beta [Halomonas utahensis]MYL73529.1 glycine--tRNA ligase subunit beta [Halomonas sp. 22501_18_FS]
MATPDFLVEVGTEELPPKALKTLSESFGEGLRSALADAGIEYGEIETFATPRRLAVRVNKLADAQPDTPFEKKGPAVKAAFDDQGNPTRALEGFARNLGIQPDELDTMETDKGAWLVYRGVEKGRPTAELLPGMVEQALNGLPIPKRMRWGSRREEFVRPVHWLIMLYGSKEVPCTVLGCEAEQATRGHRFHHPGELIISTPADYELVLRQHGWVEPDFATRRETIRSGVTRVAEEQAKGSAVINPDLLDEVTALCEWPVPLLGRFEERFLDVPPEALVSSMEEHQKYFHVVDANNTMMPCFITVANIASHDPSAVIAGNEKVIRPRLADAAFFYDTDRKTPLIDRLDDLKPIVFQQDLGSLHDKTLRIASLAGRIAEGIGADPDKARRAGTLSKTDLLTEMVQEFDDLQGVMGEYYARHDGEDESVARALSEQYLPGFAGDRVPQTDIGACVALADRLDSLVGLFGINQPPSGTRDPYALRRAALGVIRILVERELTLDLEELAGWAAREFNSLTVNDPVNPVVDYILERFRASFEDQGVPAEVFLAVQARRPTQPLDFHRRVLAVNNFIALPEAQALAAANKRVSNILEKQGGTRAGNVDPERFQEEAERALYEALQSQEEQVEPLFARGDYDAGLQSLAQLREVVDRFFNDVMVMADDDSLRANRLALLERLRQLFLRVADISLLQTGSD